MKKTLKWLAALVAIGTAIGFIIAFFCKKNHEEDSFDFGLDDDDDDFDLDSDLQPVDREYVSLNKTVADKSDKTDETDSAPSEPAVS